MQRRDVLRALTYFAGGSVLAPALSAFAASGTKERMVAHLPAIPILMFHKVNDAPKVPEDISTAQLTTLFAHAWRLGFCPVNMSDIFLGRVDDIVPKGRMPLGITADDSHPSNIFSTATAKHPALHNACSLVEILANSLQGQDVGPRATFFLSGVNDDRYSKKVGGYFGNILPLRDVADALAVMPGIELGYHTLSHIRMQGMGLSQVRALLEEQMEDLHKAQMLERVSRILAYPYGVKPTEQGIHALRELQFLGAVLAFPGVREASYAEVPQCIYDGQLMTDPFLIPRVCIGARAYAYQQSATQGAFVDIDPLDDFRKDVEMAVPRPYVSRGKSQS